MTARARRIPALAVILGLVLATVGLAPPATRAAEYEMTTAARYAVDPAAASIGVRVDVSFKNTTPDPAGRFSLFDEVKLAVHDEAAGVEASDEEGDLEVAVAVENGVNVATVTLRDGLRYEEIARFSLSYRLADSDDPQLRVGPSLVVFPAWSFGTSGQVRVTLPDGFEVRVDGDPLSASEGGDLLSGSIDDPSRWLALVTATRPPEYTTFDATVPLAGGTADLSVRAFTDDERWGEATRDLVVEALPAIEEAFGLPYPHAGRLVVSETVASDASGFAESAVDGTEIAIAYDQPPFTVLHQVAHVWLTEESIESRWLREGLASQIAATVAAELGVEPPYDPAARTAELAESAFALDTWPADADGSTEAYGYAASWAFVDELATAAGTDALRQVLARVAAGVGPYAPATVTPEPPDGGRASATSLTTRAFLDHLETVTGTPFGEAFAARVLGPADVPLLAARTEARAAFAELETAAGPWGVPDPLTAAMSAWEFEQAERQIGEASAWLTERDDLLAEIGSAGLSAPDRLQQAYRAYGGGAEAAAELEAERAVVRAYTDAADKVNGERSLLERIGLIGGPEPVSFLNLANGRFADGDLRGALDAVAEAERVVDSAGTSAIVRIVSAVLLAVLVLGAAAILARRRASYTARR